MNTFNIDKIQSISILQQAVSPNLRYVSELTFMGIRLRDSGVIGPGGNLIRISSLPNNFLKDGKVWDNPKIKICFENGEVWEGFFPTIHSAHTFLDKIKSSGNKFIDFPVAKINKPSYF